MKIKTLEMLTLHIPFYARPCHPTHATRLDPSEREQVEVYRVELDNGVIGLWRKFGGRIR